VLGTSALALFAAMAACKTATLAAQGGECSLATDCAPGLVCLAKPDGTRSCESDLSSVTKPVPMGARDTGADGTTANDDGSVPVVPPTDGATVPDTATPPRDAAPDTATPDASDGAVG
jgi:hypothetical protein